jgi:hypothetical protein
MHAKVRALLPNVTTDRSERTHRAVIDCVRYRTLRRLKLADGELNPAVHKRFVMAYPTDPKSRKAYLEFAENCFREAGQTPDRKTTEMLRTLSGRYKRMSDGLPRRNHICK